MLYGDILSGVSLFYAHIQPVFEVAVHNKGCFYGRAVFMEALLSDNK